MSRLRHQVFPGATYFVTTKTWQNTAIFQVEGVAQTLIRKMLEYRDQGNYRLHEFVVMLNHLHLLISPGPSASLERAMQLIKGGSSHEIHRLRGTNSPIWQSGFHESRVRDSRDYKAKLDYMHFNPVVAKLVDEPQDWPFGSVSGRYQLDPIPQGLKPALTLSPHVGAEAPTPNISEKTPTSGAKALVSPSQTRGLKPLPPKEQSQSEENSSAGDSSQRAKGAAG